MKKIFTILFLVACGLHVNAQYTPNSGAYQYKGLKMLNSFQPPAGTGDPVTSVNAPDNNSPAWYYNKTDTTWYQFNPVSKIWSPFIGGGGAARLRAAWNKRQYVIGEVSAENPDPGATTVVLPFAVQQHSELITYQGVPVPLYPSEDFWYNVTYDSTSTTYTFRDPLQDGYALNFQYAEADSVDDGGGGGGGSTGDADSLGGLPASAYERVSNKSTTTTLGTSNILYPTQNAVKTYTDNGLLNKADNTTEINASAPLSGGGDLSASRTITISQSGTLTDGYLSASDWNTFNNKIGVTSPATGNILYYNGGWQKLPIGTSKQTLHVVGGVPVWRDTVASTAIDYSYSTLTDGATISLNGNNGINFKVTLGGNRTLAVSNIVVGKVYTIEVNQDATGNRHLTLPANSLVANGYGSGTSIILSTGSLDKDQISFRYDGTNYLWTASLDYQ